MCPSISEQGEYRDKDMDRASDNCHHPFHCSLSSHLHYYDGGTVTAAMVNEFHRHH